MKRDPNEIDTVWEQRKQEAKRVLGDTMTKIPVRFWEANMLFSGVKNTWWRAETIGFPATEFKSGTHPLFVLRPSSNLGFNVCPCSSKGYNVQRYIQSGCGLLQSGHVMDRDSFLVERFAFTMPVSSTFKLQPGYMGKVPEACIKGGCK